MESCRIGRGNSAINTTIYKRFIRTLNEIIWAHNYPDPENLHHFDENWKEAVINVVTKEQKKQINGRKR